MMARNSLMMVVATVMVVMMVFCWRPPYGNVGTTVVVVAAQ